MNRVRSLLLCAACVLLAGCGFALRGEVQLAPALQRVHVQVSDPFGPLQHDVEVALARSGAIVEAAPGAGIAQIELTGVVLAPVVRSVGANAFVNEFSMIYHVELSVLGPDGKTLLAPQVIEHSREYTFDQTQTIGTNAEQDEIKKGMERDMVNAVMRKIETVGKSP
jgi:LPS-assembly lipoprotein